MTTIAISSANLNQEAIPKVIMTTTIIRATTTKVIILTITTTEATINTVVVATIEVITTTVREIKEGVKSKVIATAIMLMEK